MWQAMVQVLEQYSGGEVINWWNVCVCRISARADQSDLETAGWELAQYNCSKQEWIQQCKGTRRERTLLCFSDVMWCIPYSILLVTSQAKECSLLILEIFIHFSDIFKKSSQLRKLLISSIYSLSEILLLLLLFFSLSMEIHS